MTLDGKQEARPREVRGGRRSVTGSVHGSVVRLLAGMLALVPGAVGAGPHGPTGWARGDCHQHSVYSADGTWELEALWGRIRETLPVGPRFTFISDHGHIEGFFPDPRRPPRADNWGSWAKSREVRRSLGPDEYVGSGQEIGGLKGGHIGALCLPQAAGQDPPVLVRRQDRDYRVWMERIRDSGGLTVVYHPGGVRELGPIHPGQFEAWDRCLPVIDAVSIWNGYKLYDPRDEWAWRMVWRRWLEGWRFTAVAGSDAHVVSSGEGPVPYWGIEGRFSFQTHPMNPHVRVLTGPSLTEERLRRGIREGRVTLADWHENWIDLEVEAAGRGRGGGQARAGIGDQIALDQGAGVTLTVRGHGSPRVYSGNPSLEIELGRVGDPDSRRIEQAIPRGDFEVATRFTLVPGTWILTARTRVDSPLTGYWRGVQFTNPVRVVVRSPGTGSPPPPPRAR